MSTKTLPESHTSSFSNAKVHFWWQALAFVVAALVFLYFTGQLTSPFLAGDDWPMLLPASQQGGEALPWANTLAAGRWINYWWYLVTVHFTVRIGNWVFVAAYLALTYLTALLVSSKRTALLCALALFFSPMFALLSVWPNTLSIGVALCAVAMLALVRTGERWLLVVLLVSTFVLVLAYPPLASIVLVAAVLKQAKPTVRSNVLLAVGFLIAFALSMLAIYGLNAIFHGYFGVRVRPWRNPHPLKNFDDLLGNLQIAGINWKALAGRFWLPIACAGVASVALVFRRQTRARVLAVLFALVVCWCVAVGITTVGGMDNPGRSIPWLWVAACFLCAVAANERPPTYRYSGIVLLLILGVSGGFFSWSNYRYYRPIVAYQSEVAEVIHEHRGIITDGAIFIAGSVARVPMGSLFVPGGRWPEPIMDWEIWKRYGVQTHMCDYRVCISARAYAARHNTMLPAVVLIGDEQPVLIVNRYSEDQILRDYPSARQQVALHLAYPAFLRLGPSQVRITPFFPGASSKPVSIALPRSKDGYTVQSQGVSCNYPVTYQLTDAHGRQVGAGQYRAPESLIIDRSPQRDGFTLLSLRMAPGSKNNYGCNLVISRKPRLSEVSPRP